MRKIDNYFDDIPESLKPQTLIDNGILLRILTEKKVKDTDYKGKNNEVKNKLMSKYHHCCAFCEKRIEGTYDDIEHFRPKHEITGVNTEGYYWLAVIWFNLLLVCPDCNRGFKKSHFPILGNRISLPQYDDLLDFFSKVTIDFLADEQATLLHPILDDPDEHLLFEENGTVTAKNDSQKGRDSIQYYGLSDEDKRIKLIQDRKAIVDRVRSRLYHAMQNYINDERLYNDIENLLTTLSVDSQGDRPHSAVRRTCLSNFKTFFIDKFDGLDKSRLEVAYQQVLNQVS
jgi:uncharacterized protein (TIGR02646 family)